MHSSGRGEESPEPYQGAVFPSSPDESQAYGEQARPAHGAPWGPPFGQGPAAGQPAPADATQMLPPYPAGMPAPTAAQQPGAFPPAMPPQAQPAQPGMPPQYTTLPPQPGGPPPAMPSHGAHAAPAGRPAPAEATQMLPPYPAGDPAQQGAGMPPIPPQAAVQPQHAPFPGMQPPQPGEQAVEATQAMPLSVFQEQAYDGGYDGAPQNAYAQGGPAHPHGSGAPGMPHEAPAAHDGGQGLGGDYDHLFRNDVPSPAPSRPHIIQPDRRPGAAAYGQGGPTGYPPQGHDAGGYPPQGYEPRYGYEDEDRGGRRMSPKVLIGIVVGGCVVVGLVVGGLLNSGGKASADNTSAVQTTAPDTPGSTSTGPATPSDDAGKQQAQALDALLKTSGDSRAAVVNAVQSIKNCDNLPGSASDLRAAAGQRNGLVTQLGALSIDKLAGHADLADALTKAWRASAAADAHYAAWADQVAHNHKLCKGGHARSTDEVQTANRESGTATEQKKRAVRLWNHIADTYGLTTRQYSQL